MLARSAVHKSPKTRPKHYQDSVIGPRLGSGGGKDVILAHDNEFDTINCGANVDEVIFDKGLDRVAANCENRKPRTLTDQDAQAQEDLRAALSLR